MKNSTKYLLAVLLATGLITACAPEERAFHASGRLIGTNNPAAQVSLTAQVRLIEAYERTQ